MKFLSFMLLIAMSFQSMAATDLKSVMDDHKFFTTVVWDQKDQSVFKAETDKFVRNLSHFSKDEIMKELESTLSKEEIALLKIELSGASREDIGNLVLRKSEMKGASWNGTATVLAVGGAVALGAVVLYTVFLHMQLECDGLYDCHGGE